MRAMAFAAVLVFAFQARAQSHDDLKTIDAWILGGSQNEAQKEAAVVKLLESKPAIAKGRKDGQPILVYALDNVGVAGDIGRRSRKLAELLIAKGADVNAKIAEVGGKSTPLIVKYAMFARIDALKILLAKGADPNAADGDQRTALHWLATLQELDKEPRLVQQGLSAATIVFLNKLTKVDARDRWGKTPLAITAFLGNKKMTELLLARGADLNSKDKDGYSVLGVCRLRVEPATKGKPSFANAKEKDATREVIKLLVAKGAKDERPKR